MSGGPAEQRGQSRRLTRPPRRPLRTWLLRTTCGQVSASREAVKLPLTGAATAEGPASLPLTQGNAEGAPRARWGQGLPLGRAPEQARQAASSESPGRFSFALEKPPGQTPRALSQQ